MPFASPEEFLELPSALAPDAPPEALLPPLPLQPHKATAKKQVYDLDVWWHVTIGKDILTRLAIPDQDRFALAALGRPYHDSRWLFQVMLAGAHFLGGWLA